MSTHAAICILDFAGIKSPKSAQLDLNHDGIPDFDISFCACIPHGVRLQHGLSVPGNLMYGVVIRWRRRSRSKRLRTGEEQNRTKDSASG